MTVPYVNLSHTQLADLASMRIDGRYIEAYEYMRDIVHDERIQTTDTGRSYDLLKLENWLDRAASINGNDGSFSSEFVRGATEGIRERLGNPLSEAEFQASSDRLADSVLNDVITGFGIPTIAVIIGKDVAAAVGPIDEGGLGLPGWGWAGTWGDILPPPLGLGGDYQSINGESVRDYAKNWMDSASSQLIDGLGRVLLSNWGHFDKLIDGSDLVGINDINYNPMGDVEVISPTVGTTPDPLVKTIVYVDPLVLDLDGDGLEITPLSQGVLFDANGDAVKTGTAWVGSDDGLLVWDRNGNGTIDTGAELFGDETLLANGQKAPHGFAALSELDTGSVVDGITVGAGDSVFDAQDAQYNTLRIWRDLNQDGISQANELQTLAQSGVRGINLASRTTNTNYGDAILAQSGSFTRTDGSTAQAGSFILAQNNFAREFVPITVSDEAKALLDLKGSGWVRDLREAATLSPELIDAFNQVKDAPTRAGFKDAVAGLLRQWGNDSAYNNASKQALAAGYGLTLSDPEDAQEAGWMDKAIKASEADRDAYRATLNDADLAKFDAMRERMVGAWVPQTSITLWGRLLSDVTRNSLSSESKNRRSCIRRHADRRQTHCFKPRHEHHRRNQNW